MPFARYHEFLFAYYYFKNTIKRIVKKYHSAHYEDMKGYVSYFCVQRLFSFDSFFQIVKKQDFVTAHCILRMLADCVSIFRLIYLEKDEEWRLLRHYLYVLDGYKVQFDMLHSGNEDDDKEKGLSKDMEVYCQFHIDKLNSLIEESPLKKNNEEAFNKIVEKRNWKFKKFCNSSKNSYSWEEMHRLIDGPDNQEYDLYSYYSQYVHGLSMSNEYFKINEKTFSIVVEEAVFLICRFDQFVKRFYSDDMTYIMDGLNDSLIREKLQYYSDFDSNCYLYLKHLKENLGLKK